MALPVKDQVTYWSVATAVFVALLWFLGDVLLPFVLGGAIAYVLDPIADRLERMGLSRVLATVIITFGSVVVFIIASLLVIPTLVNELISLVQTLPDLLRQLAAVLTQRFPSLLDPTSQMSQSLDALGVFIQSKGGAFVEGLVGSAVSLLNIVILIVIVPVVTFYLLLDWDRMVAQIDALLPREHAPSIRQIARDIDAALAGFIRGQGTVCLILGAYYSIALMLVGLNFGFLVGSIAGALTFIPYVGAFVGGVLAIGLALFQYWGDWAWIAAVAIIFFSGQFIEGNILTPNLVGSSVGLHPVWLLLALSAFGALFGFVGMLVAVPVSAMIGVLVRFAVGQYKSGRLYRGYEDTGDD